MSSAALPGAAGLRTGSTHTTQPSANGSSTPCYRPLHHAAAAVSNGRLYVIGGFAQGFTPTNGVFEYNPASDTWSSRAPMPTARGALAAATIDDKVYAVGGVLGFGRDNVAALEVYDPIADTWETREPMARPRDHLAVGVVGGKLYALGGRLRHDFGLNLDANEAYDPMSDTWSDRSPLPGPRSGIAAAAVDGKIYVFGGESRAGTFPTTEAYDPSGDSWSRLDPMPTARHGLGAAVVGGTIYVTAGGTSPGSSDSGANEAFEP